MKYRKRGDFWGLVARTILRNRIIILLAIVATTIFWASEWKHIQFTFTEANLLPDNHPENIKYRNFTEKFGEEGNSLVFAVQDSTLFTTKNAIAWKNFNQFLEKQTEIDFVLSVNNIVEITKNE